MLNLPKTAMITSLLSIIMLSACDNSNAKPSEKPSTTETTPKTTMPPPANNDAKLQQTLADNLAKSGIHAKVLSVTPTAMPNMFWVKAEGLPAIFTDSTGQYIIQGEIVKVGNTQPEHISASLQAQENQATLASIDKKDMIIFPAQGETKGAIYVFTDADCGYCRKLHSEIDKINGLGIEVRYLPWPRSEHTFPIMESIWCNSDRQKAITDAKNGATINSPACDSPVRRIHDLGLSLGINGTPSIFTESGQQIGGYLPPERLLQAVTGSH
ncbi:protein-disulfide isomerase-like protein [Moraxella macacae 0408225]|uniref:Thiol:disulfide interchange protein n=1 Tax=Moraxella macacae 0408225 TaxID=1230338 RepID=L2F7D3_9GAMM|nr:DsbC family protein [Moraxella macacae]ELA08942.1 protein-disulfide isomerase-like protein [Moraxella macacae 0408225]